MIKGFFWVVVVIVLLAIFKGPLTFILVGIEKGILLVIGFYFTKFILERLILTALVIWGVQKLFKLFF